MSEFGSVETDIVKLDSVDWAILDILQNDATIQNRHIAERVGIAPSTCLQRIRRLRERGVISAIRAEVDPSRIGRPEQALLAIQIRPHSRETARDFVTRVQSFPETMAVYNISGTEDYFVHVAVGDSTALQTLVLDQVLSIPQVAHCRTQLIFGRPLISNVRRA